MNSSKLFKVIVLQTLFLILASTRAFGETTRWIWAKPHGSQALTATDFARCNLDAKPETSSLTSQELSDAYTSGGLIGITLLPMVQKRELTAYRAGKCMRNFGYLKLYLDSSEYKFTDSEIDSKILDNTNFDERINRLKLTNKSRFSNSLPAEFGYEAVKIDPKSLTTSGIPVSAGKSILSGKLTHRRTARLIADVQTPLGLAPKGSILQEVVDTQFGDIRSAWCGPTKKGQFQKQYIYCVWNSEDGYEFGWGAGPEHLIISPLGYTGQRTISYTQIDFEIDTSQYDLIGPMDFDIIVDNIDKHYIFLSAVATFEGKKTIFWRHIISLNLNGNASLPFWTKTLSINRSGNKVFATLTADGNGQGWPFETPPTFSGWR